MSIRDTDSIPHHGWRTVPMWDTPQLRIPTIVTAHTDERDRCSVRASVVFRV